MTKRVRKDSDDEISLMVVDCKNMKFKESWLLVKYWPKGKNGQW